MSDISSQYGKISQAEPKLRQPVEQRVEKSVGKTVPQAPTKEISQSNVEMSNMKAMADRVMSAPDINRGKVEQIKQAIKEGNYPVHPQRIAESFLAIEQMIGD